MQLMTTTCERSHSAQLRLVHVYRPLAYIIDVVSGVFSILERRNGRDTTGTEQWVKIFQLFQ